MNKIRLLKLALILAFILLINHSKATNISGIINVYIQVTFVPTNCSDSITVDSIAGFNVGDSVLIIQMQGVTMDTTNTINFGTILNYNTGGNFELLKIASINGTTIHFTSNMVNNYDATGSCQLVSYPHYTSATVTATLTAQAWNGTTGGVLAFSVGGNLTLNADIDVSGLGFRGGAASVNYYLALDSNFYEPMTPGRGGQKGEGVTPFFPNKGYARGAQANGGGGGNDVNAAGAGGGNWGKGGHGGFSYTIYTDTIWGLSGKSLSTAIATHRIFMGGGGGGGQENNDAGTAGTNGGGIILITANTIIGNNDSINSKGFSNYLTALNDGAGGAGAGGSVVLLNVPTFTGNLVIDVNGGKGGDEVYALQCHGNGGGGGGGLIYYSGLSFPANVTPLFSGGPMGNGTCLNTAGSAAAGDHGDTLFHWFIPQIPNLHIDTSICSGQSIQIGVPSVSGINYLWNNFDTSSYITVSPTTTTTYVLGISNGNCVSAIDSFIINIKPSPNASFTADTLQGCTPFTVQFTNTSTGANSYYWGFGDGGNSSSTSPSHTYQTSGTFSDTLICFNNNGCVDTLIQQNYIHVLSPQTVTASFTSAPLSGCDSVIVNFTNTSTNATSYLWKINQTDSTTTTNTSFTYHTSGTYSTELIAYNSSACGIVSDTSIQIITITVNPSAHALFTPDSTLGCVPFNVSFTNNSNNATSYNWAFGDNNFSTDSIPNHIYSSVGTYTVTLIAIGAGGCNDTAQYSFISVIKPPVVTADFTADTLYGCNPLTVQFTNTSTNGISYLWNFGDSITSTSTNPSHTYTDTGLFTVQLTTINDTSICGRVEDSTTKIQYIAVENPVKITSNFDVSPLRGCTPLIVTISNNSTNGTSYLWSFGNGDSSIIKNPFQEFYLDSGTFYITLITYNPNAVCYNPPDTLTLEVHADSCDLFIPNVFTPNGDNLNDVFDFVAEGYTQYHLKIYDRWGLLVFESTDNNIKWNGRINNTGGDAPDGTYYYIFTSIDYNQQPFITHGFLTLIR